MWEAVYPGILVSQLFSRDVCEEWLRDIAAARNGFGSAPNSINKYGVVLAKSPHLRDLVFLVQRHAESAFPEFRRLRKDPYAFAVDYSMKTQRSLAAHTDTSDVTLNVCLTSGFTGGDLVFGEGRKRFVLKHKLGQAIIHRGAHIHRAMPLTSGTRTNLILWCAQRGSKH